MKTFEDYLRNLVAFGGPNPVPNVNEYGVTLSVYVAEKGYQTFVVNGDRVTTTTEPIPPPVTP